MRRKIKKLNYEIINLYGYDVNFARSKTYSIHITIKSNNQIYLVAPIFTPEFSIRSFFKSKLKWIEKALKTNEDKYSDDKIIIKSDYRLKAKEERELINKLNEYIKHYELLMGTEVNEVKLRKMKSFGMCHVKTKIIIFNKALYFLPDEFKEAIVVHEMAHIFVPNHSAAFYKKIEKYLPKYREIWRKYRKIIVFEND